MNTVRTELSKSELDRLFAGAVDEALADRDEVLFKAQLDASVELRGKFESYQRAVSLLKKAPKEKAPAAMSSLIMRRVKRRRNFDRRATLMAQAQSLVPAQVLIPILIGVMVAAFLVFAAP